jgi:hypothetical protein
MLSSMFIDSAHLARPEARGMSGLVSDPDLKVPNQ